VLRALPAVDAVLVTGDVVGYGPDPNAVVARLRQEGVRALQGNHDRAIQDAQLLSWFNPHAAAALEWTRGVLSPDNLRYLTRLPMTRRVGPHRFVHGSPRKPYIWEYILEVERAREILAGLGDRLCFFGHTHLPRIFTAEAEVVPERLPASRWYPLPTSALVNPGSVGQPRDGIPDAAFAVVDLDGPAVQFHRVPYDIQTTQAKILAAGLPEVEAARLAIGM
jgi:diadenosine tetraphosphatase ApaH/serine/threonine PP2A family protein phosphatase